MIYRVAICDDDENYRTYVSSVLTEYFGSCNEDCIISEYSSGDEFLFHAKRNFFDIVLLDVEMHGTNGIDVANTFRDIDKDAIIIFTTAHEECVFSSFRAEPLVFLVKPIDKDVLKESIDKAVKKLKYVQSKKFIFTSRRTTIAVPIRDIIYFESNGRVIDLVTAREKLSFYGKLDNIQCEDILNGFIRCHQSFLVNPNYIAEIASSELILANKVRIPIRRGAAKDIKANFLNYLSSIEL